MKRAYVRPTMVGERFVANEYVAACGDENKVYKFKCTAGNGQSGRVYLETNGKPGLQEGVFGIGGDQMLGWYHACGIEHEASTTDAFLQGYYVPDRGATQDVIVWRGENGKNIHCTTDLDINTWETAKS